MTSRFASYFVVSVYAFLTLLSALLLFEVQPIISKCILPWFGGSPAVWTTSMVFFQTLLFAGYAYAHLSEKLLPRWAQAVVHVCLLFGAAMTLPIAPAASWKLEAGSTPTWHIIALLSVSVGLPYFVLSSTGPLVQAWYSRFATGRSPYRLYALSNIGSLVALLGYPFFVEPRYALGQQTGIWSAGFVAFAALGAVAAIVATRGSAGRKQAHAASTHSPPLPDWRTKLAWVALPALASMMLLATTNHVCQDVAVMPFLWVAPLSIYLLSFIITFDHPRWYQQRWYALAALVSLGLVIAVDKLITGGANVAFSFTQELTLHFAALFFLCMLCHGELFRLRPDARHLTAFYLMISAGGALGGLFVSLAAPFLFSTFAEWRIGIVLGCLLAVWVLFQNQPQSFIHRRFALLAPAFLLMLAGLQAIPQFNTTRANELFKSARNFYGVISVLERERENPEQHVFNFYSGRIVHGVQFAAADKRRQPTAYFGPQTGVGRAFGARRDQAGLRVGVVGLGIGTLAAYARPDSTFRFYELNDHVLEFARDYFTYLADCQGETEIVLGDARVSLEQESPQHFDLLVLDAFSGDAVPTHLLTKEAWEAYRKHLAPGATIAVNISNRYVDLSPVVAGLAEHFGYRLSRFTTEGNPSAGLFPADWIVVETAVVPETLTSAVEHSGAPRKSVLWTDDYSNLFELLK
jgi:hypothetical protein